MVAGLLGRRPEEQGVSEQSSLRDAWIAGYEAAAGVGIWNERFDGLRVPIFEAADRWVVEQEARGGGDDGRLPEESA